MTLQRNTFIAVLLVLASGLGVASCSNGEPPADAYGNYEVDEVTISSKTRGELLEFDVEEGESLASGQLVGLVDTTELHLQRAELNASMQATQAQRKTVAARLDVAKDQLKKLENDHRRIQSMYNDKAATQKQLDDITSAVGIAQRNLDVLRSQYPAIQAQVEAIDARGELLEQKFRDAMLTNPIDGVVLTKFVQQHENIAPGKPLYTIANLEHLYLKAFVSGDQLSEIKLGQSVNVFTDNSDGTMKPHSGVISWISSKAEFTPKTVQTREERVALVYAIKILVDNDGDIKVGMPGEARWSAE